MTMMLSTASAVVCALCGFWGGGTAETPVISVPVAPNGQVFAEWKQDDGSVVGGHDECSWWNGTYYYDPGMCDTFSVTRINSATAQKAIDRANMCGGAHTTDCVLSGEIGFNIPAAFIYDDTEGMKMLVAPRFLLPDGDAETKAKTIRMQDPAGVHPNQLFEFNDTVTVEYLKGGARTLVTETLVGNDAYCLQTLRRAVVPSCWESLD